MNDAEVAWLAGLYEGEGTLGLSKGRSVRVSIGMTDLDVLEHCASISGLGSIRGPELRGSNKPMWRWNVQKRDQVLELLANLYPLLGKRRRARIDEALEHMNRPKKKRGVRPLTLIVHGTRSGFSKELKRNLEPCQECRDADNQYQRQRRLEQERVW